MFSCVCLALVLAQVADPTVRFRAADVVARLSDEAARQLPAGRLSQERGQATLAVSLVHAGPDLPILGTYERTGKELVFTPRFAFVAGQKYRARLSDAGATVVANYDVPATASKASPKVVKVYPTADVLPANHLKFYIYFDRPMRGGPDLFRQIALMDDKGKEIADPWLVEELWDEKENCLILYIHPGRIKWGVDLRELLGPVLYEKRTYSLVIRGTMSDLEGNAIGKDVVKKFRTTAEDRVRINLGDGKLSTPAAQSREPLVLALPKSIDHRSLQRFLHVSDGKGQRIEGTAAAGPFERSWHFTPRQPWHKDRYHVDVAGELEDVAGNTPLRPFDFDVSAARQAPQSMRLEFEPR